MNQPLSKRLLILLPFCILISVALAAVDGIRCSFFNDSANALSFINFLETLSAAFNMYLGLTVLSFVLGWGILVKLLKLRPVLAFLCVSIFLVCLAVMMAIAAKDISGKVWAIFFPIMAFVTSGFEHCVANMYFIPAGIFAKAFPGAVEASGKTAEQLATLNWATMWTNNLITVTIGNIVGGAIFVGVVYYFLYVRGTETNAK